MISVIVPIYKVEKYLNRCVESILNQSYTDFELLLIDDGSPDGCPQICDEYARQDTRVRVFHKPNGGLSDARNYGLDRMQGEYVTFVDSDDYVGPDYLRILMELAESHSVPVAAVAHLCISDTDAAFVSSMDDRSVIPNGEIMKAMAEGRIIFSAWGKLIHEDLFAQARFPVGYLFEDNLLMPYLLCDCASIAVSTSRQYYWLKRPDSIMGTVSEKKVLDWEEGIDRLLDFTKEKYPNSLLYVEGWVADVIWHIAIDQLVFTECYSQHARRIREKYGSILRRSRKLPVIIRGRKLKAIRLARCYAQMSEILCTDKL